MSSILIIRKGEGRKALVLTKAREAAIREALKSCRVARPEILELFLSGEFAAMESIPQSVIDNPIKRARDFAGVGFVVPEGSMGRAPKNGTRDMASTAESIRIWIGKYLIETGLVRKDELSVIVVEDEA
jgi:hypothetical protein